MYPLRFMKPAGHRFPRVLMTVVAVLSCRIVSGQTGPPIVQPGAPGKPSRVIEAKEAVDLSGVQYTDPDVRFMQGMIAHHAQALEMTALIPARSAGESMKKLGLRIEISQADEIEMMKDWLRSRGQEVPDLRAHHAHGATLMPGMLTPEEMDLLAAANGTAFDRLFLELMIKHHEGALIMVEDLFSQPGAGQESEIFAFTSDVTADQSMEIDRMSAMLEELSR